MTDFIFLGSKITVDSDYTQEIKRCLLLGRKDMTNLDSIWKSRDITLPTKFIYIVAHSGSIHVIEKAMAAHSSTLAWKIPWTEEPGRLQSMGSLRIGHD